MPDPHVCRACWTVDRPHLVRSISPRRRGATQSRWWRVTRATRHRAGADGHTDIHGRHLSTPLPPMAPPRQIDLARIWHGPAGNPRKHALNCSLGASVRCLVSRSKQWRSTLLGRHSVDRKQNQPAVPAATKTTPVHIGPVPVRRRTDCIDITPAEPNESKRTEVV